MEMTIFCLFALISLGSALAVVLHKDPVKATLSLVLTLFATAVLFILLGAPFIGVLQVLIYTGAIVVLFLFVIMLLNLQREEAPSGDRGQRLGAYIGAGSLLGILGVGLWKATAGAPPEAALTESFVSLREFSSELFGRFLLPFEIVGLLLLVAVIGAFVVAKRPEAPTSTHSNDQAEG